MPYKGLTAAPMNRKLGGPHSRSGSFGELVPPCHRTPDCAGRSLFTTPNKLSGQPGVSTSLSSMSLKHHFQCLYTTDSIE
jgi:hypothetical protein